MKLKQALDERSTTLVNNNYAYTFEGSDIKRRFHYS